MGPIWDRQDPDGPHIGPMNIAIWVIMLCNGWNIFYNSEVTEKTTGVSSTLIWCLRKTSMQGPLLIWIFLEYIAMGIEQIWFVGNLWQIVIIHQLGSVSSRSTCYCCTFTSEAHVIAEFILHIYNIGQKLGHFRPWHAEILYLHFQSVLKIEVAHVVKILPHGRQGSFYPTQSVPSQIAKFMGPT